MKVLFLDVDGVLSTPRLVAASGSRDAVSPAACALVNEVLEATGALVVVSSTWRRDADCRATLTAAGLLDRFHPRWRTPPHPSEDEMADPDRPRGSEIDLWFDPGEPVEAYAILDDDPGVLEHQRPHLVATRFEKGVFPIHVVAAIAALSTPAAGRTP